jgi:hypothetical protein
MGGLDIKQRVPLDFLFFLTPQALNGKHFIDFFFGIDFIDFHFDRIFFIHVNDINGQKEKKKINLFHE